MIAGDKNGNKCIILYQGEDVTFPSHSVLKHCAHCFSCDPILLNKWYQSLDSTWWGSGS